MQSTFTQLNMWTGDAIVWFLLDTFAKATVLLVVACLAARLLRRASAAVRHRVWYLGFLSLLVLPVLSLALPGWRIPIVPRLILAEGASVRAPELNTLQASSSSRHATAREVTLQASSAQEMATLAAHDLADMHPNPATTAPGAPTGESNRRRNGAASGWDWTATMQLWGVMIILSWLIGAAAALLPLILSLAQDRRRGKNAQPVADPEGRRLLGEVCGVLGVRRLVRLLEVEEPVVPMTWGVWRPTVLLPRSWRAWAPQKQRMILLHELAHVQRCDVGVQVLARLACALYWFHPLAWYALRQLRIERESACDDWALMAGERSSDYAQQLLEIARDYHLVARSAAAVTMAQSTRLERRVRALLDRAHSHLPISRGMGRWILAGSAAVLVGVAAIGPARTAEPQGASSAFSATPAEQTPSTRDDADSMSAPQITFRGTVLSPDGKPVANATVRAAISQWAMLQPIMAERGGPPVSQAKTNAKGEFTISFPEQPLGDLSRLDRFWQDIASKTHIAASAPGYGPAWVDYEETQPNEPVTLRLVADVPVKGRVIDSEGRPVAGLAIEVGTVRAAKDDDLAPWLRAVKAGEPPWTAFKLAPKEIEPELVNVPEQVTTDAQGRFEIHGVGRQRHLDLSFKSETAAHVSFGIVTQPMERIDQVILPRSSEGTQPLYGAEFTVTTTPSRAIVGTVRDAKTGQPMARVSVESFKLVGYPFHGHRVLKTTTDPEGRFRLAGMPKGDGNELLAVPNDDQPYFMRSVEVPNPEGDGPATVDIRLDRGIWITGRVTDKATGQPVPARLHYLPFLSNPFPETIASFHKSRDWGNVDGDQARYHTRPDGTYRLVGLPGPAIVGAQSVLRQYRIGLGSEEIEGLDEKGDFNTYANPLRPGRTWPNVLKKIDPPAGAESVTANFEMDPGQSVRIAMVDPAGQPISDVRVDGVTSRGYPETIRAATFEAVDYAPNETRTIVFHHKGRKLGWVARIAATQGGSQPVTVRLQPTALVKGRLVKPDGTPMTGAWIDVWCSPSEDFGKRLPSLTTDAEGRFEGTILPGSRYFFTVNDAARVPEDLPIEPGQVKDLGNITIAQKTSGN